MTDVAELLTLARRAAGLSQEELAGRAGTSRTTLSAYEHGRKSPTSDTVSRLLAEIGLELTVRPQVEDVEHTTPQGRTVTTLSHLPRLPLDQAFATVTLPIHLNWSQPGRQFDLSNRAERARVYEIVLREGGSEDIYRYVDGALLIDLWDQLVIPRAVRAAWAPVVEADANRAA
ncbi:MAG: helix-turn-helix domain-containing protein [Actinophytocola sp.]|uniref:helix-turn-helix domain-containing protein n=1 Tax=Actinophytocola sp. TaxID=1872138 RepID=UPI001320DBAD|nr:helix-turn-helix transcriptional regulator [Actinophytocola sp.]MPZ83335.1 helix-turn-helix domain-containing protein [Actinophytocola sp.]